MFVELAGDDPAELRRRADAVVADAAALDARVVTDPVQALALWRIREDGAGLAGVSLARPAYGGWEDAAVPPSQLGAYLRDFDALLREHRLDGLPYGHFGDGCVHVRIDFPLTDPGGASAYRSFVEAAATLVAGYGGSMSGEHGDGRARSGLLPAMYSPAALSLFGQVKACFDPDNRLNPGVLVDPARVDADLRTTALIGRFDDFAEAVHRCTGVGKCLADTTAGLGVMCPSYLATREEKDSTRGRARVLQEMINGGTIRKGWGSAAVHSALDLCLSCKGCARDCPTGIDMAAYKAEVLDKTYAGRLRPRSHYALGWLPRWARLITRHPALARLVNLTTGNPGHAPRGAVVGRSGPAPFASPLRRGRRRGDGSRCRPAEGRPVVVWVDSFSDGFAGGGVEAVVEVLTAAGYAPRFLERSGLLRADLDQHRPARRRPPPAARRAGRAASGGGRGHPRWWGWSRRAPRSGAATPRSCYPVTTRVAAVRSGVLTLAELLSRTDGWSPPDLSGVEVVAQPHCHHASVLGWATDAALLNASGAQVTTVGGCCGLAGNFGVEQGHYEVSVKIAEHDLLPAAAAHPDAVVLADGFSCRTQLAELAGREAVTLAELLLLRGPAATRGTASRSQARSSARP